MKDIPHHGLLAGPDGRPRCWWHGGHDDYLAYHDLEWGRPVSQENRLFEKLSLEGFQAGLSWLTILRKRERFRALFLEFDFHAVAAFTERDVQRLLGDAGIVRHRGKIEATVHNAGLACRLADEFGSLASYVWRFEPLPPKGKRRVDLGTNVTQAVESRAMSRDLKRRGWRFVGPTTVYAFMQSMGLVNDHLEGCVLREEVETERRLFERPV